MKDLEKRKRIMRRSMRLGHCICNAKQPCPCDTFRRYDVCQCAGERLEVPTGPVRLTQLVENAGCASKIDQAALKSVLKHLPEMRDPRVLVGMAAGDDAGVYQLRRGLALVQTVDVFSPSLDDPYLFGQVAAANSLSDVYAMGGRPLTALSIIGFPIRSVPDRVMADILRGGIDKMAEAGVPVIGGHSIKDAEIKAGFAVTGVIDPRKMTTNAGARPGDVLILTKPLGTGIIAFAAQIGRARAESVEAAAKSMTALNKTAAELMVAAGAHACTDVTGFGLMGHLSEMARASGVGVEILWDDLPLLPGVIELVAQEIIPGGIERNRESSAGAVTLGRGVQPAMLDVCLDPQTSGGLLIAVAARKAAPLIEKLRRSGVAEAVVIGKVRRKGRGRVYLETRGSRPIPAKKPSGTQLPPKEESDMKKKAKKEECCAEAAAAGASCCPDSSAAGSSSCADSAAMRGEGVAATGPAAEVRRKFLDFHKQATAAPGAIDAATKEAVSVALSLVTRCGPCTKFHLARAREMGFSEQKIEELALMAVAFGGCPVMMFYNETKKS